MSVKELFQKESIPYFKCLDCIFVFSTPERNPNLENRLEDYESAYIDYLRESPEDSKNFDALIDWISGFRPLEAHRAGSSHGARGHFCAGH